MIYFIGASCGDPDLITVKAMKILEIADAVLYTGSLIPKEILNWCKSDAIIFDSQNMKYSNIFELFIKYKDSIFIRLHTGDPSIYSTIAKQIIFLKSNNIEYKIIPGISAAFGAASSLNIEYTIPGVSQTLVLTRIEGKTPQPEELKNILRLKKSSLVFYLSISLLKYLKKEAMKLDYNKKTPCWVIHKATWADEEIYKGNISDIEEKVTHINGLALILFGEFLYQKESCESHLYTKHIK